MDTATLLSVCALGLLSASALAFAAAKTERLAFALAWHLPLVAACGALGFAALITTDWLITPFAVALGAANWWAKGSSAAKS